MFYCYVTLGYKKCAICWKVLLWCKSPEDYFFHSSYTSLKASVSGSYPEHIAGWLGSRLHNTASFWRRWSFFYHLLLLALYIFESSIHILGIMCDFSVQSAWNIVVQKMCVVFCCCYCCCFYTKMTSLYNIWLGTRGDCGKGGVQSLLR